MADAAFDRLAERLGLQTSFVDGTGVRRETSVEGTMALLRARGVPIDRPDQAHAALASWEKRQAGRRSVPFVVAWDGSGPVVRVRTATWDEPVECRLTLADGTSTTWVTANGHEHPSGTRGVPVRRIALPGDLPLGRHELVVQTRGGTTRTTVLAAPATAPNDGEGDGSRAWGVFLPLHAAWHRPARGRPGAPIGDLGDLRRVASWAQGAGATLVTTLPLLAGFVEEPAEPSPYAPSSRLAWNEIYLDLEDLPDELVDDAVVARRRSLRRFAAGQVGQRHVDVGAVSAAKRRLLDAVAAAVDDVPALRGELERFLERNPSVTAFARFRALGEVAGRDWSRWPARWRDGRIGPGDADAAVVRVHEVAQWLMARQLGQLAADLRAGGMGLGLDLPIGAHPHGFDRWQHRDVFAAGVTVGAPPDAFFPHGQNWGFPPIRPDGASVDQWAYVSASLEHQMRVADHLRVDHVMGLSRQFWIPDGGSASDGAYVRYPADELTALLTSIAHRHGTRLLGEDLGTVPDEVRDLMGRHRIAGSYVAQFETTADPDVPVRAPRPAQVASWGTHDLPPFTAWWSGADLDERVALGLLDPDAAADAREARDRARTAVERLAGHVEGTVERTSGDGAGSVAGAAPTESDAAASGAGSRDEGVDAATAFGSVLEFLGRSDADLVLVDVEDLLGEIDAQNVPGTHLERANWTRRAACPVEELGARRDVAAALRRLDHARRAPRVADLATQSWLGPDDLHLFNEGTHVLLADKLGAHPRVVDGVAGVQFAVWAPDAESVSVVGDFDDWDRTRHPMVPVSRSGIWQTFVPGLRSGELYKYSVRSRFGGPLLEKADPFAFRAEAPPRTASVVWRGRHRWRDASWLAERSQRQGAARPMSIYEVHLGSWRRVPEDGDRWLTYRELGPALASYCTDMGFTHVELMPIMEHPYSPSWGYQITGYFAPTARFGTPDDFAAMVDDLHGAGIGVILDWVPSHFPADGHGLAYFDGTYLYEHADPRRRIQPDWDSLIFNYGRREVQAFLISNARFWIERFHADGLRVDAVASMLYLDYSRRAGDWVPNVWGGNEHLEAIAFLRRLNSELYGAFDDVVLMAEESTAWPGVSAPVHDGGLGFGFKWDLGWMHDTLRYLRRDPAHRRWHHHELTFRSLYAPSEHFVLPLSHDEVVHGKGTLLSGMPGDRWQQFANLRLLFGYQYTVPGVPLLFMGSELGTWEEWSHDRSLPWHLLEQDDHAGVQRWVRHLNHLLRDTPALYEVDRDPSGFDWIDADDSIHSVYAWVRRSASGEPAVVVMNATPVPRPDYRLRVPPAVGWRVAANSDDREFGGSGAMLHLEPVGAGPVTELVMQLPPLGIVVLVPTGSA